MKRHASCLSLMTAVLAIWLFTPAHATDGDSTRALYPETIVRAYSLTMWDKQSQSFLLPLAQVTARHRERNSLLLAKYDLGKGQLVELYGQYKPYSWLGLQTGQFRTPPGYDIPQSEYNLFSVVPVNYIVPNTYDRGVMAIMTTPHTTTMVAGINGEGYASSNTDNATDVAYRLNCRFSPVSASYSRQYNSWRRYSAGSVMVRDEYVTVVFTKAIRSGDYRATVDQLQLTSAHWSDWRFGVQFSRYDRRDMFQRGSVFGRITTAQSTTDFALERRFGDLNRIRVEWLPFEGSDDQWRVTIQYGFVHNR